VNRRFRDLRDFVFVRVIDLVVYFGISRQGHGHDIDPDTAVAERCHGDGSCPFFDQGHEFDEHRFPFLYCMSPVND
jgi:hypothetical protein